MIYFEFIKVLPVMFVALYYLHENSLCPLLCCMCILGKHAGYSVIIFILKKPDIHKYPKLGYMLAKKILFGPHFFWASLHLLGLHPKNLDKTG